MQRATIATLLLTLTVFGTTPVAQAGTGDAIFDLLKKYHPDKDGIEFARYYVNNPKHGDVVYSKVAAQDYVFIGILVGAKAARNQKILPGGQPFDYNACTTPINTFNAVFATSSDFIEKYGQEEHIKDYLQSQNEEGKQEAEKQLAEYVPYWKEIPSICHFTFFTNFEDEQHIRETLSGSWKLIRGGVEDFSNGNVASGVAQLAQSGVTGETACMIADNAISGGMIGNVPVLGSLAKSACAGFAGAVIQGINTAAGAVVNAVGEFIGDFACAAGIGACTGNKPVDGIFNPNFENLVINWMTTNPAVAPEVWANEWYAKIQGPRCHNQTGAPEQVCRAAFDQANASAKARAEALRAEAPRIYETIYKPKLNERVLGTQGQWGGMKLFGICVDDLLAKYPWPGPQLIGDQHNKPIIDVCDEARDRADLGGGKSFEEQVTQKRKQLEAMIMICPGTDPKDPLKRRCGTYPARIMCTGAFVQAGVDRGTAETEYCRLDAFAANVFVAQVVGESTSCKSQVTAASGFAMRCGSYADQLACVQKIPKLGAPDTLVAGCKVDKALADKDVMDRMLISLGLGSDLGPKKCEATKFEGNPAFMCAQAESWKGCKTARAKQSAAPASIGRCLFEIQMVKTIPSGGGGKTLPGGGTKTIPLPGGHVIGEGNKDTTKVIDSNPGTKTIPVNPGTKTIPANPGTKTVTANPGTKTVRTPGSTAAKDTSKDASKDTSKSTGSRPAPATTTTAQREAAPTHEQVVSSLTRRGCKEAGVRWSFECSSDAGFKACEMYLAKKQVRACKRVR